MSKKHFIALADAIREHNASEGHTLRGDFNQMHIEVLADFCQSQNPNFNRGRWLAYIAGECGSNGGKIKAA